MIPIRRKDCVGSGAKANVHKANETIVVKVPNSSTIAEGNSPFSQEAKFYNRVLGEKERCPDIVECFIASSDFIFLSYCCNNTLAHRYFKYQEREIRPNGRPGKLLSVKEYEDPALIARWIQQLTSALAFMEKLGYTHNDLHPRNCLLDENLNLKLSDFDQATTIGQFLESLMEPWAIKLTSGPLRNTYGLTSARTEQFAIGTFLFTMVYGHEPYEDIHLEEDPIELRRRFRAFDFPELNRHEVFDEFISACWHNVYPNMALVAYDIKRKTKDIASPPRNKAIDHLKEKNACIALLQGGLLGPEQALSYQPYWQRYLHAVIGRFLYLWKCSFNLLGTLFCR
ncbi:serine/threonine protein kinase [Trichophyton rubrum D6]|uniref:non-specific serine/threonine protein kinase n=4 Tax=Trichophyton TaxID=5550 RepID=A0A178F8E1_TRIRU|nr:serine/threonine protein kinase [Trichophyton rubrum CBS 118892]EZF28069.1 serine/threonine protein kinase [Trichophyton rubrum MR850]EZF47084.1 serine/threonine protein kinase [Trichophyton rubrum CBS 100081]EZF57735.1 serine/threonine protein kinase [Trichophyton rubrum CBS 288.86]EZF68346.1 serine/threonine protein kinase [Trichophyton rubrum CBS 289.86]EZF79010.1 serine/threonine protein kinase [Trichophyton soudanense CBS 452.61]EZF89659.1 serine/threonine protein kinase [Trichophyton